MKEDKRKKLLEKVLSLHYACNRSIPCFNLNIKDGNVVQLALQPNRTTFVSFGEDSKNQASVKISLDLDTFQKLFTGRMTSQEAYMKGLVSISGKMTDAMKLDSVVAALTK